MSKKTWVIGFIIVAVAVSLAYVFIPIFTHYANICIVWTMDTFKPVYDTFAANPVFGPVVSTVASLIGARFFYGNIIKSIKTQAQGQISGLTDNLIQTSGVANTIQQTNTELSKELEYVKTELQDLKNSDPTANYETLLEQQEGRIANLIGQIDGLQTALLNKDTKFVEKLIVK